MSMSRSLLVFSLAGTLLCSSSLPSAASDVDLAAAAAGARLRELAFTCEEGLGNFQIEKVFAYAESKGDIVESKGIEDVCPEVMDAIKEFAAAIKAAGYEIEPKRQNRLMCDRLPNDKHQTCFEAGNGLKAANSLGRAVQRINYESIREAAEKLKPILELHAKYENDKDLVRKVLNYTSYGDDEGVNSRAPVIAMGFWYPIEKNECVYGNAEYFWGQAQGQQRIVRLNEVDPRNIKVAPDGSVVLGQEGQFSCQNCDQDRLLRGWEKVYKKDCKGKQKDF